MEIGLNKYEIWVFQGSNCKEYRFVRCDAVLSGTHVMPCRRGLLLLSSQKPKTSIYTFQRSLHIRETLQGCLLLKPPNTTIHSRLGNLAANRPFLGLYFWSVQNANWQISAYYFRHINLSVRTSVRVHKRHAVFMKGLSWILILESFTEVLKSSGVARFFSGTPSH